MQIATTDADGRYEFMNLPASRYTLFVTLNGYVSLQFGQQRPFEPGKPLNLAEGEVAEKIDFALPRGGVIAGKVTDETGEPVPGIRMQAQRYQYMPGGQRRLVNTQLGIPFGSITDDRGEFRVYGLMPGSYVVSASPSMIGSAAMTAGAGTASPAEMMGLPRHIFQAPPMLTRRRRSPWSVAQEATAIFAVASARMSRISGVVRNSRATRSDACS